MAAASIPVDLFNPGQVFACLGFLEAAEVLLGDAAGGFDWRDGANTRFCLRAAGDKNPFGVVLQFLAHADIRPYAPRGQSTPVASVATKNSAAPARDDPSPVHGPVDPDGLEAFPSPDVDMMALPILLVGSLNDRQRCLHISHWVDASSRNNFKLYSGNRSAHGIARAMLAGTRTKPSKNQVEGGVRTRGLSALWQEQAAKLEAQPFHMLTPLGGSFNFDPRGAWTGIDAGYSPNDQNHAVAASPVVEILAALGLEHTRPDEFNPSQVRYAVWSSLLPPILARPALAGGRLAIPMRIYHFTLGSSGKNKVVTFAQEEMNP